MYKSVEAIRHLREEKHSVLRGIYAGGDFNEVYKRQKELGSMSIMIYSDVDSVLLPVLKEDGVRNIVLPRISKRLGKLSFVSIPSPFEMQKKLDEALGQNKAGKQAIPIVKVDELPRKGEKIRKRIPLPAFLLILAAQILMIPILLATASGTAMAIVKVLGIVNGVCILAEIAGYLGVFSKSGNTGDTSRYEQQKDFSQTAAPDSESICRGIINEAYKDNCIILDRWFDELIKITEEEIDKEKRGEA